MILKSKKNEDIWDIQRQYGLRKRQYIYYPQQNDEVQQSYIHSLALNLFPAASDPTEYQTSRTRCDRYLGTDTARHGKARQPRAPPASPANRPR